MKKINYLIVVLILIMVLFFVGCDNSAAIIKENSGFYISFTDLRSIIASSIENKEEISKMYENVKPSYMYGYNFTFLYISEDGQFYHYFSAKDELIQETIGKINATNDTTFNLTGETNIIERGKNKDKTTFTAIMEKEKDSTNILKLKYLDANKITYKLYASTGYKKLDNIDDMMFLTFNSITNYCEKIDDDKALTNFPEVIELFKKANEEINNWKSIQIETAFYSQEDGNKNNFIFIDKEEERFIFFEKDKLIYDGKYSFEGKNIIVIDYEKRDFLPFAITPNFENNTISSFTTVEGRTFNKYKNLDYLVEVDNDTLESVVDYPIKSKTLKSLAVKLIQSKSESDNIENQ